MRSYRRSPEPAEDLLQVGYLGLLKAINNFDPSCGDSLNAYAQPCISGEIKRHFRDRRWQIRVRRQDQELLLELRAAEEMLTQQLGRTPGDRELARHLSVTVDDLRQARQAHQAFAASSLDAPLSGSDDPGLLTNAAELSELVTGQLADGTLHLTVDVAGLDFADTAGIRVFLLAAKTLRQRGGDLVLLRPQRTLARILEILGAEEVLAIREGTGATLEPEP